MAYNAKSWLHRVGIWAAIITPLVPIIVAIIQKGKSASVDNSGSSNSQVGAIQISSSPNSRINLIQESPGASITEIRPPFSQKEITKASPEISVEWYAVNDDIGLPRHLKRYIFVIRNKNLNYINIEDFHIKIKFSNCVESVRKNPVSIYYLSNDGFKLEGKHAGNPATKEFSLEVGKWTPSSGVNEINSNEVSVAKRNWPQGVDFIQGEIIVDTNKPWPGFTDVDGHYDGWYCFSVDGRPYRKDIGGNPVDYDLVGRLKNKFIDSSVFKAICDNDQGYIHVSLLIPTSSAHFPEYVFPQMDNGICRFEVFVDNSQQLGFKLKKAGTKSTDLRIKLTDNVRRNDPERHSFELLWSTHGVCMYLDGKAVSNLDQSPTK